MLQFLDGGGDENWFQPAGREQLGRSSPPHAAPGGRIVVWSSFAQTAADRFGDVLGDRLDFVRDGERFAGDFLLGVFGDFLGDLLGDLLGDFLGIAFFIGFYSTFFFSLNCLEGDQRSASQAPPKSS